MNPPKRPTSAKAAKQARATEPGAGSTAPLQDPLQRLVEAHPLLFRGRPPRIASDLPPGWYALMDSLCEQIDAVLGADAPTFRVDQIKEKFGTLRLYWSLGRRSRSTVDVISASGHVRFGTSTRDEIAARIDMLISAAEAESARTCEQCGAPGRLMNSRSGWLSVRCNEHARAAG